VARSGIRRELCLVLFGLLSLGGLACERHDIGRDCPRLLEGSDPGGAAGTRVETQEVVQQDVTFPCDELICIASDGRPGYCSKRCREDAGCPNGFECRTVQSIGPFAGEKFCAWKRCDARTDCGPKEDFCCVLAPSPEAGQELKLCDFKEGKCP
jgi:hypothetical protein